MSRGDLVAALLENDLLVASPFEVGELHDQVAVGVVPLAHLAGTHFERGEGAADDLGVRRKPRGDALEAFLVALAAFVGGNADHGEHFADTGDDSADCDVVADFLGVHIANRVYCVFTFCIGSEEHVIATSHVPLQVVRLVRIRDFSFLRLGALFSMSLPISTREANPTFKISVGVVGSSVYGIVRSKSSTTSSNSST